jgi:hypothetical protein
MTQPRHIREYIREILSKLEYKELELPEIVRTRNKERLEGFCLTRTYDEVISVAKRLGIDLGELEELLAEI